MDRRRLPGHNAVPTVSVYEFDGKRTESLSWSTTDGITSASPAQRHAIADQNVTTPALLGRLREALELPGQASDYHFALLGTYEKLWPRRREDSRLLDELEALCLLDMQLVEAQREIIINNYGNGPAFLHVPAFGRLIQLYEREGFLHEAIEVAERAEQVAQVVPLQELRERLARIENEASYI